MKKFFISIFIFILFFSFACPAFAIPVLPSGRRALQPVPIPAPSGIIESHGPSGFEFDLQPNQNAQNAENFQNLKVSNNSLKKSAGSNLTIVNWLLAILIAFLIIIFVLLKFKKDVKINE